MAHGNDDVERALLAALRAQPDDTAAREVYADWLEEHGQLERAVFVRHAGTPLAEGLGPAADLVEARWRALVSRTPVARCGVTFDFRCPKRWEDLARTEDELVRHCDACAQPVYFCTDLVQVRTRGAQQQCVAFDAILARSGAELGWDAARREATTPVMMGMVAVDTRPPPPPPPPEPKGLVARIRGWFKRS